MMGLFKTNTMNNKPQVGNTLLVIFNQKLPGKDEGPAIKQGEQYVLKAIHVDSMGFEHYDIGLPLTIAYVTSFQTGETLPKGTHWCSPNRFVLWNPVTMKL